MWQAQLDAAGIASASVLKGHSIGHFVMAAHAAIAGREFAIVRYPVLKITTSRAAKRAMDERHSTRKRTAMRSASSQDPSCSLGIAAEVGYAITRIDERENMQSPNAGMSASLDGTLFGLGLNTPPWLMIPLALLASELLPLPFDYAADLFFPHRQMGGPGLGSYGIVVALIVGCLIGPLAETAFHQWGCITLLRKKLGVGPWAAVVLSAALFASMHFYSWKYVLTTFPVGLVLGYVFVVEQTRRGRAFGMVALIHSLRNAISIALLFYWL
jgi:hypothetical protein